MDNINTLRDFDTYINKLVEKKVCEILDRYGIECSDYAIVEDVTTDDSGNVTSAIIKTSTGNRVNITNKSGEIIAVGDTVKTYGSRKNLSNRYIGIKCGTAMITTDDLIELNEIEDVTEKATEETTVDDSTTDTTNT